MTILRALSSAIKLPRRVPLASGGGLMSGIGSMLSAGAQSGMGAYSAVGAFYGPTRRICESVALTNWSLYTQTMKAGNTSRELVDDATAPAKHPATAIWTHPNDFMTRRFFLFLTQLWLETANGLCYWLICPRDTNASPFIRAGVSCDYELWPIPPQRIQPIPDPQAYISGYWYTIGTERIPLPIQAVVPLILPDPADPMKGVGPFTPIGIDMEAERYASQFQRNTFLNDAQPGGVIQYDVPLERTRFDELANRWREQHQGVSNAKRVAIIEQGKWIGTGSTNADLEYDKLRHLSRETVMFAEGMPFAMMQTNDVNLANATMGEKLFYRWTLKPRLELIKEALNERVLPLLDEMLTMDYVLPAPEDEAFDVYSGVTSWLSGLAKRNEAREALGYDADPDWDGYISDMPNVTVPQPAMMPVKPPRAPSHLSYRGETKWTSTPAYERMTNTWPPRLEDVRQQYQDYLAGTNGRNGH